MSHKRLDGKPIINYTNKKDPGIAARALKARTRIWSQVAAAPSRVGACDPASALRAAALARPAFKS